LMLLPGLACDAELWTHQRAALMGGGTPSTPPRAVSVTDVHQRADSLPQMAALLLAEHPGEFALVGCSMGGMLALEVQRQAPDRVRGLALLGSTARADTPALITLRRQAIDLFAQGQSEALVRANAALAFHPQHVAGLVEAYVAMVLRAGADSLIRQNRAVMARADLRKSLAAVACPTLVVAGLDDQLTPPDCAREMAEAIPGAQLKLLPACGHMLTWEQPQAVTALLLYWAAGLN
jgi:pimeloyl-ACP methyl ester carboxylesterase